MDSSSTAHQEPEKPIWQQDTLKGGMAWVDCPEVCTGHGIYWTFSAGIRPRDSLETAQAASKPERLPKLQGSQGFPLSPRMELPVGSQRADFHSVPFPFTARCWSMRSMTCVQGHPSAASAP